MVKRMVLIVLDNWHKRPCWFCPTKSFKLSHRMFTSYPGSKTYFSHIGISPGSPHLLSHGRKIVLAIAEGAQDISQLAVSLEPLQTLHAYRLRIHPSNFKVFVKHPRTHCQHSQSDWNQHIFHHKSSYNFANTTWTINFQLFQMIVLNIRIGRRSMLFVFTKVTACWTKQPFASLQLFSHCMLVTLACYLGEEFTPVAHAAVDKYLSAFAAVLAEKYRWDPTSIHGTAGKNDDAVCEEMSYSVCDHFNVLFHINKNANMKFPILELELIFFYIFLFVKYKCYTKNGPLGKISLYKFKDI